MSDYTMSINIDELLTPAINRVKAEMKDRLKADAMKIVEEEIARFSIDLSRFVTIDRFAQEIRITIHRDMKEKE